MGKKSFTLLELIIVIIIVAVLVAIGLVQYTKMVEHSRAAEAKSIIGAILKTARTYYYENGTTNGFNEAAAGIGAGAGQIPGPAPSCQPTHYFAYWIGSAGGNSVQICASRCEIGGKNPNVNNSGYYVIIYSVDLSGTFADSWTYLFNW